MTLRCVLAPVGVAAAAAVVLSAPAAHGSVIAQSVAHDASFNALGLAEVFVAQGRIGNNQMNGDQEADLGDTSAAPAAQKQFQWGSNQPIPFTLTYDASTRAVTFDIFGGAPMSYTAGGTDPVAGMAIRTRATTRYAGMSVDISGLVVDGMSPSIDSVGAANPGDGVEYLLLTGPAFADGFTMTGFATLEFDMGDMPNGSHLAFQMKAVVPGPGALGLAALAPAAFLRRRRA